MVVLTDGEIFEDPLNLMTVIKSPKMQGVKRFAIGVRASSRGQAPPDPVQPGVGRSQGSWSRLLQAAYLNPVVHNHSSTSFLPGPMSRASLPPPTGSSRGRFISQCGCGSHASSDGENSGHSGSPQEGHRGWGKDGPGGDGAELSFGGRTGYRGGGEGCAGSGNSCAGMTRSLACSGRCRRLEPRVCLQGRTGSRESSGQVMEALKARGRAGSALSLGLESSVLRKQAALTVLTHLFGPVCRWERHLRSRRLRRN